MRTGAAAPVRNSGVEIRIGRRKAALSASSARCLGMTHLFAAILIFAKGNMPQNVYKIRKSVRFYRFLCFLIDFLPKHPYNGGSKKKQSYPAALP